MKKISTCFTSLIACVCLLVVTETTFGQTVGFQAQGKDAVYAPDGGATSGYGNASHMGRVFGSGFALQGEAVDPENFPGLFNWTATDYSFTSEKGDSLAMCGGGTVQLIPLDPEDLSLGYFAIWTGEFFVKGGQIQNRDVIATDEPIQVTAVNDPFFLDDEEWTYSWRLKGKITLGKKNKKK